jgi:CRP-like cAMP-binding protein
VSFTQPRAGTSGTPEGPREVVVRLVERRLVSVTGAARLRRFGNLNAKDVAEFEKLTADHDSCRPHAALYREGSQPDTMIVILSGYACQYKTLKNGVRQITAVLMPGDIDPLSSMSQRAIDYSVGSLSDVTMARVAGARARHLLNECSNVREALLAYLRCNEAQLKETLLNVTRRQAAERTAFLLSTLWSRARDMGLIQKGELRCPITQSDLADLLNLTAVHVNRTLQKLRASGLVTFKYGILTVPDPDGLWLFADAGKSGV